MHVWGSRRRGRRLVRRERGQQCGDSLHKLGHCHVRACANRVCQRVHVLQRDCGRELAGHSPCVCPCRREQCRKFEEDRSGYQGSDNHHVWLWHHQCWPSRRVCRRLFRLGAGLLEQSRPKGHPVFQRHQHYSRHSHSKQAGWHWNKRWLQVSQSHSYTSIQRVRLDCRQRQQCHQETGPDLPGRHDVCWNLFWHSTVHCW